MKKFQNKIALITGGSKGIGSHIAKKLSEEGCNIAFTYMRNKSGADKTKLSISKQGVDCISLKANLSKENDIKNIIKEVENHYGSIDFLINNAATGINTKAEDLTTKHWDWVLNTNSRGPWLLAINASKIMPRGGSIINITSLGSQKVLTNYFSVGVSKAALESITRYLSIELSRKNIKVNSISPGVIKTEAIESFPESSELHQMANKKTPAGRFLKEEDVADLVSFLCSEKSEMIRGQNIIIDGGESLIK